MSDPILRVVIVDDHVLFLEGIAALLEQTRRFQVVAHGRTSREAEDLAHQHTPDLLLLDVELNDEPAPQTIRRIKRHSPDCRIIMLTMHRDEILKNELVRAGADLYLTKDLPSRRIIDALLEVQVPASPSGLSLSPERSETILSSRESEVLRLLALAIRNREIGVRLGISEGTVKRHTSNIFRKLGAFSRMDAVQRGRRLGLLDRDSL